MTYLSFAVGSIIGPIGVCVASELIIAVSAAAPTKVQPNFCCGFEILEDSFGIGEMASERAAIVSAKSSDCETDIGRVPSAAYIYEPTIAW